MYTALSVKDQPFSIRYPKASSVEFQELDQINYYQLGVGMWSKRGRCFDTSNWTHDL